MEIRFNVTGADRKRLVDAFSEIVGCKAVYMKAPSFAYTVGNYRIDKDGTLMFEERACQEDVENLLAALAEHGFASDEPLDTFSSDTETQSEAVPVEDTPDVLAIEMPLVGFSASALDNLEKLVASKAALIMKAIGTDVLQIERVDGRLRFPWFSPAASPEEVAAYTQFIHALCDMAKKQKRVTAKEKPAESEKFAFRCFLLRLGFIGSEYAAARKILLSRLSGDSSFKNGKRKVESEASYEGANVADSGGEPVVESNAGEGEPGANGAEFREEEAVYA